MQVPAGKFPAAARAYPWMDPQGLLTITFHPVLAQPACLGYQFIHLFPAYLGLCLFRILGPSQTCNLLLYNKIVSVIRGPLSVLRQYSSNFTNRPSSPPLEMGFFHDAFNPISFMYLRSPKYIYADEPTHLFLRKSPYLL